jgi:hypothetical protein
MKSITKCFSFFLLVCTVACCLETRPAKDCTNFVEAPDPAPDTTADWSHVSGILHAAFGSIDERYAKSSVPAVQSRAWEGSGWRGERVSAQAVVWSSQDIEQIECTFSPFRSEAGALDASIARARFVRYVLTDIFEPGCGHRKPENFPASLSADMLDTLSCFHLDAQTARPVWLTFDIPADAAPGTYTGTLTVSARKKKAQQLDICLEVLPQTLPPPREWQFYLDLWQHPSAVARVNGVEPWSEAHWQLLEAPMSMLADAGQKSITATLNKDPWNNQCYDAYSDMIVWQKKSDGTWTYDYTAFDRWVTMMMRLGIDKYINCYSLLPWNYEIHYLDETAGTYVNVSARPGTEPFNALWTPFLKNFREHQKEKGWLEKTNIAMDERSPQDMKAAITLLKTIAPEFGISLADNHKSYKQYPFLRDISIAFSASFAEEDLNLRKANGLTSTYYVCCADKYPNVFTFSDPAEAAFIAWYAVASGLDGFLRWAYNSWTENPLLDSRFRTWPAGDTYIIYPGARSSIRFERLREGIQDAEKIRILRRQFASPDESNRDKPGQLNAALASLLTTSDTAPCNIQLNKAKQTLETLSRNH